MVLRLLLALAVQTEKMFPLQLSILTHLFLLPKSLGLKKRIL
jgi:hypothetical protein